MSDASPRKRGPNKPLQGKFEIQFLQETEVPARKPLTGGGAHGPRDTELSNMVKQLAAHAGTLAVIFTSPNRDEVFVRRASLLECAKRLGVELDKDKTASRVFVKNGAPVTDAEGKEVYALYAMAKAS